MKNRFFFFGTYERTQADEGRTHLLTVPTARTRMGDLGAYTAQIYDPAGGLPPDQRLPFPGNVIPPERLSPQALAILQFVPLPNAPGTANGTRDNYVASGTTTTRQNNWRRLDDRISESLNVFARYNQFDSTIDAPVAFGRGA